MQHCTQPSERIRTELMRAGFPHHRRHVPIRTFSSGAQARLHFLTLKLLQPTLMILDEPTNHIDVQGIEIGPSPRPRQLPGIRWRTSPVNRFSRPFCG
jgi:ATPase subunit of ABC transporter with duplicated ATPase domains